MATVTARMNIAIESCATTTSHALLGGTHACASCSHAAASVAKQYNSPPVVGQQFPAIGKVTVGPATHWPCVADLSIGYPFTRSMPK